MSPRWPEKKEEKKTKRTPVAVEESAAEEAQDDPKIQKAIDATIALVRKKFGDDAIFRFKEFSEHGDQILATIKTGISTVDNMFLAASGELLGGWPLPRLTQISGPESVGKSSWCKKLIALLQAQGYICGFVDAEISPDSQERMLAFGVDIDNLLWSETLVIERAFEIMGVMIGSLAKHDKPSAIVFDSVAAADMHASKERDFDETGRRAAKAAFLSENLPKLLGMLPGTRTSLIFVNQMRTTANAMPFQDPNYEPGGRALRHFSQLILRMSNLGKLKKGGTDIGIKSRILIKKSKICIPFKRAQIAIHFDGTVTALDEDTDGDE